MTTTAFIVGFALGLMVMGGIALLALARYTGD